MQRIHFTAADLARTRLQSTLGPVAEGVFALGVLTHCRNPDYARWRADTLGRLRETSSLNRPLVPLLRALKAPDDLLFLLDSSPDADTSALAALSLTRTDATRLAVDMWRAGVAPYWDRVLERLDSECDTHGRIAMTGGVEQLLGTLHPRIIWNPPVLEIHNGPDRDVHLRGQGLLLNPSAFLPGLVGRVIAAERDSDQSALVFSVPPDVSGLFAVPDAPEVTGGQALSALVGQTRAAALRALTNTCTTSQLAARLGVSPGSASQHASVLRESGLITTRRVRNSALHSVTPLGMALLGGRLRKTPATARPDTRPAAVKEPPRPRTARQ
ncbi:winged helix-turn-helix domain-containing protein [Streptomyces sp. NPDC051662]|uniref:ArsR/SmtB family transcription factor n=1 Tax=Streptomyces sp. NPDC051662 TaxID=3154750 RepID=UPI00343CD9D0